MVLKAKSDGKKANQPLVIGKEYKVIDIATPFTMHCFLADILNRLWILAILYYPKTPAYMLTVIWDDNFDVNKYRYDHIQMNKSVELGTGRFYVEIDNEKYTVRHYWNDYFESNTKSVKQLIRNHTIKEIID